MPDGNRLEEINVERINVVDKNGNPRIVLANKDLSPDVVVDGRTYESKSGRRPGIIFYNDEGDECGGLIFSGMKTENGYVSGASLTFDQFKQDQILGIQSTESDGQRTYGFYVWDRPSTPITELMKQYEEIRTMPDTPEKKRVLTEFRSSSGVRRIFMGKRNGDLLLTMADSKGNDRIRMIVDANDVPRLEFLNEQGQIVFTFPPASIE